MNDRLQELAEICEDRKLSRDELNEAFALSVAAQTVEEVEAWLASTKDPEEGDDA